MTYLLSNDAFESCFENKTESFEKRKFKHYGNLSTILFIKAQDLFLHRAKSNLIDLINKNHGESTINLSLKKNKEKLTGI